MTRQILHAKNIWFSELYAQWSNSADVIAKVYYYLGLICSIKHIKNRVQL